VLNGGALSGQGGGGPLRLGVGRQDGDEDRDEKVVIHDTHSLALRIPRTPRKTPEARLVLRGVHPVKPWVPLGSPPRGPLALPRLIAAERHPPHPRP
jgi:hypothetical protein